MPCRNDYEDELYAKADREKTTRMLCESCRIVEEYLGSHGLNQRCSSELKEWWNKHKEFDKREGRL